jgi:hypothetical protein
MVGLAPAASAHSVSGIGATNWKTTLVGVTPATAGLTVKVVENGSRLEAINRGPEVTVFGYESEPYLRIGPAGVFINTVSPAAYLNCSRTGCPVPALADARGAPRWQQISTGQTILWHDHRIHWMGQQLPPEVARAPGARHVQAHWSVAMAQGPTIIPVTGDYTWVPGPTPVPWLLVALALVGVGLVVARSRSRRLLAGATALLVAVDFGHAVAVAWFWAGSWVYRVAQLLEGSSYQLPGWILGVVAARLLWQGRARGQQAALAAGASALVFTGLLDVTVLGRSDSPSVGSITVARLCVAVCLGLGAGVMLAALARLRADRPKVLYTDDDHDADDADAADAV